MGWDGFWARLRRVGWISGEMGGGMYGPKPVPFRRGFAALVDFQFEGSGGLSGLKPRSTEGVVPTGLPLNCWHLPHAKARG